MHNALVLAGKRAPAADIRGFFPGTCMDRIMRWWLDQDDPQPGQMAERAVQILTEQETEARDTGDGVVRWKGPQDKTEVIARLIEGSRRLEPILYKLVVPHDYQTAVRFSSPITLPHLDGTPTLCTLIGEMDLLVRKPPLAEGGPPVYTVWDLKFTKDTGYWRKVTGQLLFYDVAVFLGWKAWPASSGLIQPECREPVLSFSFTPEHRRELLLRIAKYAEDMWRGDVSLAPKASTCYYCDTKHACPRFSAPGGGRTVIGGTT